MVHDQIYDNVLDLVGNTPCVRLHKLAKLYGLQCELIVKLEFYNPGGSIKDRVAKNMILEAERSGVLKPGDTLVEPTSGNTGIGLALAAAAKGYNCVLTMPKKMSNEKVCTLKALGSDVIRTPDGATVEDPESQFGVARRLVQENPGTHHILDQYSNPANPAAHMKATAEEIYRQTGGQLDMIVMSVGTGGTLSGTSRRLKQLIPNLKVVGVDPAGSILHDDCALKHPWSVEGIGQTVILPKVLDRGVVDEWAITQDIESYAVARQMIALEGILCGGSSGAAMAGALMKAKQLGPGQRCLVVLPDSIRNYMSRFINDEWLDENGFAQVHENIAAPIPDILAAQSKPPLTREALAGFAASPERSYRSGSFHTSPSMDSNSSDSDTASHFRAGFRVRHPSCLPEGCKRVATKYLPTVAPVYMRTVAPARVRY